MTEWRANPSELVLPLLAAAQALLVLGPGLGPGVVVTHDMPWSPDPRWTPFVLGLDTPAPRAVPSDAIAVLLGKVVGAGLAQHLVLGGILVALGLGAAALLREMIPDCRVEARAAAAVAVVWNPYVSERLAVGQWTILLGLAVLPWALRAALRVVTASTSGYAVLLALVCAAAGGVNPVLVVASAVILVLLTGAVLERSPRVGLVAAMSVLVTFGVSAAWAIPGLTNRPTSTDAGLHAFAPVADSPVGVIGSLAGGGGFWNTGSHPEPRGQALVAGTAALLGVVGVGLALARGRGTPRLLLGAAVLVPTAVVLVSATEALTPVWGWLVAGLPGGGALRDSQKLMAAWVVVSAVGLGVLAHEVRARMPAGLVGPGLVLLVGLPLVLSPQLAWGVGGRLDAVTVPRDYRAAVDALAVLPAGQVGILPWNQYRRYDWNADRVSLTLAPRLIDRVTVHDDSLPLREGTVPGESPRSALVSRWIADGVTPGEALAGAGVRYIVAELRAGLPIDTGQLRTLGTVVVDTERLLIIDLGRAGTETSWPAALRWGWWVTILTATVVVGWRVVRGCTRKLLMGLLASTS